MQGIPRLLHSHLCADCIVGGCCLCELHLQLPPCLSDAGQLQPKQTAQGFARVAPLRSSCASPTTHRGESRDPAAVPRTSVLSSRFSSCRSFTRASSCCCSCSSSRRRANADSRPVGCGGGRKGHMSQHPGCDECAQRGTAQAVAVPSKKTAHVPAPNSAGRPQWWSLAPRSSRARARLLTLVCLLCCCLQPAHLLVPAVDLCLQGGHLVGEARQLTHQLLTLGPRIRQLRQGGAGRGDRAACMMKCTPTTLLTTARARAPWSVHCEAASGEETQP